jgi:death-on-curing protein
MSGPSPRDPQYLEPDDVIELYAGFFGCDWQSARDQVRSYDLLASAVARPRNHASYNDADIALQAAVLAHGLCENQPLVEGNRRTALVAMGAVLQVNGIVLTCPDSDLFGWILDLSAGLTVDELAANLRKHFAPL